LLAPPATSFSPPPKPARVAGFFMPRSDGVNIASLQMSRSFFACYIDLMFSIRFNLPVVLKV
jgi:hypothetical protein